MEIFIAILIAAAVLALLITYLLRQKNKPAAAQPIPSTYRLILLERVDFYKNLSEEKRKEFEERVQLFLAKTKITGVKTTIEDLDKILIASSAVIPIFGFPGWEYVNLREVLVYPDSFNHDFEQTGNERNVLGMVGNGPLERVMILSQNELRQAFLNKTGKTNMAIHEFVHLVDKMDGSTDGLPEFIVDKQYILPWLQLMRSEIKNILDGQSDLNPYGSTNEAEFFAVASEYFFERPELLKEKHPELYDILVKIFQQESINS